MNIEQRGRERDDDDDDLLFVLTKTTNRHSIKGYYKALPGEDRPQDFRVNK
jgi:hypothetical protein